MYKRGCVSEAKLSHVHAVLVSSIAEAKQGEKVEWASPMRQSGEVRLVRFRHRLEGKVCYLYMLDSKAYTVVTSRVLFSCPIIIVFAWP